MNKKTDLIAKIISLGFSPFWTLPLVFIYIIINNYSRWQDQLAVSSKFILLAVIPVIAILFYLRKTGKISSLDMTDRRERHLFNISALMVVLVFLLSAKYLGLDKIAGYILLSFIGFSSLTLITFFWKISGHTSSVTFFFLILFNFSIYLIIIGLPLIAAVVWSRIHLKKHSVAQTIGGIILALSVFYLGKILKLI